MLRQRLSTTRGVKCMCTFHIGIASFPHSWLSSFNEIHTPAHLRYRGKVGLTASQLRWKKWRTSYIILPGSLQQLQHCYSHSSGLPSARLTIWPASSTPFSHREAYSTTSLHTSRSIHQSPMPETGQNRGTSL